MVEAQHLAARPVRPAHAFPLWAGTVLLVLLVSFGGGFLIRQATVSSPAKLAPDWVVRLVDRNFVALNAGSAADLRATLTDDVVLTDMRTGERWIGATHVVGYILAFDDMSVKRTSDIVYKDGYATFTFRYGDGVSSAPAVTTFRIENGAIADQWVMSDQPGGFSV